MQTGRENEYFNIFNKTFLKLRCYRIVCGNSCPFYSIFVISNDFLSLSSTILRDPNREFV